MRGPTTDSVLKAQAEQLLEQLDPPRPVTGLEVSLLGIDVRPATGDLYGLSSPNRLYTVGTATGEATQVSRLSEGFEAGVRSGVDFNPAADRLRIIGANGQNFRIDVDMGEVTLDGELAFVEGDPNEGARPGIIASAYTNNVEGTETTWALISVR